MFVKCIHRPIASTNYNVNVIHSLHSLSSVLFNLIVCGVCVCACIENEQVIALVFIKFHLDGISYSSLSYKREKNAITLLK